MNRKRYQLTLPRRVLELGERTLIMGVINVTPDSFSDGGEFFGTEQAIDRAFEIEAQGADIIDVGGESTRPGSKPISVKEEMSRVIPVIQQIAGRLNVPISIDTTKYEVAQAALEAGAEILNDVSGLNRDARLADLAAKYGAALVLMHMRGTPETMQQQPPSPNIFAEMDDYFRRAVEVALARSLRRERIVLDPGIGFGKTLEQNLAIINRLDRLSGFGLPLMIGTSRKTFIGTITGKEPRERLFGTAASIVAAIFRGAHIVRVHDVREMVEVVRVADAIFGTGGLRVDARWVDW